MLAYADVSHSKGERKMRRDIKRQTEKQRDRQRNGYTNVDYDNNESILLL